MDADASFRGGGGRARSRSAPCSPPPGWPAGDVVAALIVAVLLTRLKVRGQTADTMYVLSTEGISSARFPRKAEGFVSRTIADDVIIVPVRGGVGDLESIFTLNAVGASIWKLIDGKSSVQALAAALSREYEVSEAEAAADVQEFVALLLAKGLVSEVSP